MLSKKAQVAPAGHYIIVGRRDDTDEIVSSVVNDVPRRPRLTTLCRRSLYEMGINDPLLYEFLHMMWVIPGGGVQMVLDQAALRRYVHANYS